MSQKLFQQAAQILANDVDWSGGDGETMYYLVHHETDDTITENDFEKDNHKWQRAFRTWCLDTIQYKYYEIRNLFKGNVLPVWREITAAPDWRPDPARHLGICWSWDKHAAEAHWGEFGNGHVKWLLSAEVFETAIDWMHTLALNASPSYEDEREIRLFPEASIRLLRVERRNKHG